MSTLFRQSLLGLSALSGVLLSSAPAMADCSWWQIWCSEPAVAAVPPTPAPALPVNDIVANNTYWLDDARAAALDADPGSLDKVDAVAEDLRVALGDDFNIDNVSTELNDRVHLALLDTCRAGPNPICAAEAAVEAIYFGILWWASRPTAFKPDGTDDDGNPFTYTPNRDFKYSDGSGKVYGDKNGRYYKDPAQAAASANKKPDVAVITGPDCKEPRAVGNWVIGDKALEGRLQPGEATDDVAEPRLPKRSAVRNWPTHGVLSLNGQEIGLASGKNVNEETGNTGIGSGEILRPANKLGSLFYHVEMHAAALLSLSCSPTATLTINHRTGPCALCVPNASVYLVKDKILYVRWKDVTGVSAQQVPGAVVRGRFVGQGGWQKPPQ